MPEGVHDMKIKFKKDKLVKNTQVKDYICLNGKKLSEQTINDYAPFIPSWNEREELKEDSYLVRCVFPHNHLHNDDNFSMVISKGHTRNVVIACRSGCCNNFEILQYFLSRLTGEAPMPVKRAPIKELTIEEERRIMEQKNTDRIWRKHLRSIRRRSR